MTIGAFLPYIRSVIRGKTKPHVFTWGIWGLATVAVFVAQLSDGGGVGAWPIGVSGLVTFSVVALALARKADTTIVWIDWVLLVLALSALPVWVVTSDPLAAVVILTFVDLLGFGPSVRKAYDHPFDENVTFFVIVALRNFLVVGALENYSWTTVLFPAVIGLACALFAVMIMRRRQTLRISEMYALRPGQNP
jgi:hypothetical protein